MCSKTAETKKTAVYRAVLALLGNGADLQALKVQQIAEAAGIGKGTVYEYFSSKEEILQGMTRYCVENETAGLRAALAPCATLQTLLDALEGYLREVLHTRAAAYRVLSRTLAQQEPPAATCRSVSDIFALFGETVARLQAAGEIPPALGQDFCVFAITAACAGCLVACGAEAELEKQSLQNARLLMQRALGQ